MSSNQSTLDDEQQLIARSLPFESESSQAHDLRTVPLFTREAFVVNQHLFPYKGLLGTILHQFRAGLATVPRDSRLYVNTQTTFSAVVCGAQGSGKSHSVSCLLEDYLLQDTQIGGQPEPLAAVVFHFDKEHGGKPCEAAYLCSPSPLSKSGAAVKDVTILVSPRNLMRMAYVYSSLPNVRVRPLYFHESHLTITRVLSMMGCDIETLPLDMFLSLSIILGMGSDYFSYTGFRRKLQEPSFNAAQRAKIEILTTLLDPFIGVNSNEVTNFFGQGKLVIVDLSDPFLDGGQAALLFDLILDLFVQWEPAVAKIVVLDKVHKYFTNNESAGLTKSVESLLRQQRRLGMGVIISTQEPTVVPSSILDLTSFIICHKLSSPTWCTHLSSHVSIESNDATQQWFEQVMQLSTGQAILFSSGALVVAETDSPTPESLLFLGVGHLLIQIRPRITLDGSTSTIPGHQVTSPQRDYAIRPIIERANDQTVRVVTPPVLPVPLVSARPERASPSLSHQPTAIVANYTAQNAPRPLPTASSSSLSTTSSLVTPLTPSNPIFAMFFPSVVEILQEQLRIRSPATCFKVSDICNLANQKHPNITQTLGPKGWKKFYTAAEQAGVIQLVLLPASGSKEKWMYLPGVTELVPASS